MYCTAACRNKPLLLSTCQVFYFQYGSIILTRLWASIGVTHSYLSHPFLCALDVYIERKADQQNIIYECPWTSLFGGLEKVTSYCTAIHPIQQYNKYMHYGYPGLLLSCAIQWMVRGRLSLWETHRDSASPARHTFWYVHYCWQRMVAMRGVGGGLVCEWKYSIILANIRTGHCGEGGHGITYQICKPWKSEFINKNLWFVCKQLVLKGFSLFSIHITGNLTQKLCYIIGYLLKHKWHLSLSNNCYVCSFIHSVYTKSA